MPACVDPRALGRATRTVRRRIAEGELTAHRFDPRLIKIKAADVEASLRRIPSAVA
jgi:excisionase family DNA binding protein